MRIIDKRKEYIVLLLIMMPFLCTIIFTLPSADDFTMTKYLVNSDNYLLSAIMATNKWWFEWGGAWPWIFIEILINPIVYFSPTGYAVGFFLCLSFALLTILLYRYMETIQIKLFDIPNNVAKYVSFGLIFIFLNSNRYPEIFYWFVGNAYVWIMLSMLLLQIMIIKLNENPSYLGMFCTSLVGFITCFGIQIAVFSGIFYLLILLIYKNYKRIMYYVPMIAMIIGGLLSAFSPGNFARHDDINQGYNLKQTLLWVFQHTVNFIIDAIINPINLVIFIGCILVGMFFVRRHQKYVWFYLICAIASVIGTIFPLVLGYSSDNMPNRQVFVINSVLYINLVCLFLLMGVYISSKISLNKIGKERIIYSYAMIAILGLFIIEEGYLDNNVRFMELPCIYSITNISHVYDERNMVVSQLREIEESDEAELILYEKNPENVLKTGLIRKIGLTEDPEKWSNKDVATYYGKSQIIMYTIE